MSSFYNKYIERQKEVSSVLCVGLDPDINLIPKDYFKGDTLSGIEEFLQDIIKSTTAFTCAYKPNLAFYEALGEEGLILLKKTISYIRDHSPNALVLLDAKRGDIGNTATFYAKSIFEDLNGDAVTLSPYMGLDTLDPFLAYKDKAVIVLCNTSNDGASWLQEHGNPPLYLKIAQDLQEHPCKDQIWLVAGATRSTENLKSIKQVAPSLPLLVPGVGAQGGTVSDVMNATGPNVLINVGRSILYAGKKRSDVMEMSKKKAKEFCNQMKPYL